MSNHSNNVSKPRIASVPSVIVIGGTSGVGLALAKKHLALGWQVVVVGSNADKIAQLNQQFPEIVTYQYNLCDPDQLTRLFTQLNHFIQSNSQSATSYFNRLFYCAGWYLNERVFTLDKKDSAHMLAINLQVFNRVFEWASEILKATTIASDIKSNRTRPALICLASIAGTLNYPYASLYAKCKHAMIANASAYRLALQPFGIQVNCMAMGYVNTLALRALNDGDASHKPFLMSTDKAVSTIMQSIEADIELAVFPKQMRYLTQALDKLPSPILYWLMHKKL